MIRRNLHSLGEIEAVRVKALHAGIQFEVITTVCARLFDQPIEQLAAETF